MKAFNLKVISFYTAIANLYREEDNREESPIKMELKSETLTEDITAMLNGLFLFYQKLTGDKESDVIDFTYMLNKLAVQRLMEVREAKNNGQN